MSLRSWQEFYWVPSEKENKHLKETLCFQDSRWSNQLLASCLEWIPWGNERWKIIPSRWVNKQRHNSKIVSILLSRITIQLRGNEPKREWGTEWFHVESARRTAGSHNPARSRGCDVRGDISPIDERGERPSKPRCKKDRRKAIWHGTSEYWKQIRLMVFSDADARVQLI